MQAAVDDEEVVEGHVFVGEGGGEGAGGVKAVEGDGQPRGTGQADDPGDVFPAGDRVGVHYVDKTVGD
jgi:hypothetical protein